MDLQTMGGKPVTSENVPSIDNLRAYSPQISVDSRRQPTAAGHRASHFYDDLVTVAMPDDRHSFFTATSFGAAIAPW